MSAKSTTTFTSRGRLTGLIRNEAPAGTGQNRASRSAARGEAARPPTTRRSTTGPA